MSLYHTADTRICRISWQGEGSRGRRLRGKRGRGRTGGLKEWVREGAEGDEE